MPKHTTENEEVVVRMHLRQCRHHGQQHPQPKEQPIVAQYRVAQKYSDFLFRIHRILNFWGQSYEKKLNYQLSIVIYFVPLHHVKDFGSHQHL